MANITQGRLHSDSINFNKRKDESDEAAQNSFLMKQGSTGDYPRVDNSRPALFAKYLIPVSISEIEIIKLAKRMTASQLISDAKRIGFDVDTFEFPIYSRSKQGRTRLLSNSDIVANFGSLYGKPNNPLTERIDNIKKIREKLISFNNLIVDKASAFSDPVRFDEEDDAKRLTIQRTQFYGRFLALPASTDLIDVKYPKRFLEIIDIVAKHYIETTERLMPSRINAMTQIVDAMETAVGGPSFSSSGVNEYSMGYHEKRMVTLFDMPVPDYSLPADQFLSDAYQWGESLGLPDGSMTFAAALSYRQGAKGHKAQRLWYYNGEFCCDYEAKSWESNQRLVYPASHALNVVLTPAVLQMKTFRKMKLGMYHTPETVGKYIQRLNAQGSISYESDFSSFDTTISNQIMQYVSDALAKQASKFKWEFTLFRDFLSSTGVIFPSFETDEPQYVSYFSKAVALLSGTLPTSEMGSIVSVCANLFALEKQLPTIVNDWINGKFIILIQSDDVLFTLPKAIDEKLFTSEMGRLRLTAKLKEGNMFLKKLLPVGTLQKYLKNFPIAGVPLWSRQTQQTYFNENDLDGKPDAILRLALLSRSEGLNKHPMFDAQLDASWKSILESSPIFVPVLSNLYDGVLSLSDEDKDAVIRYSSGEEGMAWLSKIYNRAESDPKAKELIMEMAKLGFDLSKYEDTAVSQRRAYLQALYSRPNSTSRDGINKILSWLGS